MKEIRTEIEIHANVSTVWNVLMNFENYPNWNPFIKNISGEKASGKRITVSIKPPDANGMTFKPVILKLDTDKEFRWRGTLGIKGIFDGEHFFILERVTDDKTKFIHGEKFSGVLVALMSQTLNKTKKGFEFMNEAIKRECESK